MGCDIHLTAEVRINEVWTEAESLEVDKYGFETFPGYYEPGRNYNLFAALGDVRNYHTISPLPSYRGIPDDASKIVRSWATDGDHSHNWLTLREILDFDWTQKVHMTGVVSHREWATWVYRGQPNSWAGAVAGGTVIHVEPEQMAKAWERTKRYFNLPDQRVASSHFYGEPDEIERYFLGQFEGKPYTQICWDIELCTYCKEFWSETIPRLLRLTKNPEDVRIVFWFDS